MDERESPLYSADAEQAVLGSMLNDSDCVKFVMEKLQISDFYVSINQEIFDVIHFMFFHAKPIDGLTVAETLQKNRKKDSKTNEKEVRAYLAQLINTTPTSANVMEYAAIVRDRALLRSIFQMSSEITELIQSGTEEGEKVLELCEQRIRDIRQGEITEGLIPLREALQEVLDRLEEMSASEDHLPGLSTGFSSLDRKITGLNKSDLILLAARPGMGKTALALNIALNVAKSSDTTVVIFSLEMSCEQIATRILSAEALVENARLKTGRLQNSDWEKIARVSAVLSKVNILLNDNPMISVADMRAKCHGIENLGLVVIDYLQLMTSDRSRGNENRQQIISDISRTLKIMAKELNVPVMCLSQLSRANEKRDDKHPLLSDLRDSGAIEQDADIVLFLYRDDYYNEDSEQHNIAECIVAKNRHGETGKIELRWTPEYTIFSTLEMYREDS